MTQTSAQDQSAETQSAGGLLLSLVRFLRVVRHRKQLVIASVLVAGVLGAIYFFAVTRIYRSSAALLVLQTGADVWSTSMSPEGQKQGLMPTYEQLFTSTVVLQAAVSKLQQMPAEVQVDFEGVAPAKRVEKLRDSLSARTRRRTNIIDIDYRSKSPEAAVTVVNAVLDSYLEFMDKNHKTVATEILTVLKKSLAETEGKLTKKEDALRKMQRTHGPVMLEEHKEQLHPLVENVVKLNESLLQVQKRRVELEASLAAIRAAVQAGHDLRQHLLAIEPFVGREVVSSALGFSDRDANVLADVERRLLSDRAKLQGLRGHLGPKHPEVVALLQSIRNSEAFLAGYQDRLKKRLVDFERGQLKTVLVGLVEEELSRTRKYEEKLAAEYKIAEAKALKLKDLTYQHQTLERSIKQLRNLHEVLVGRIADINVSENQSSIRTRVVSTPELPKRPISPRLSRVGGAALLLGLVFGLALVYVFDVLDDRFRSPEEMRDELGVPLLAMVRRFEREAETGPKAVKVHVAPDAVESEAFRTLRTTLAFSDGECTRISVSSAEPGDGKTTVIANLAASYAQAGKRTLLIDADLRRPGLTKLFEMRAAGGLSEILREREDMEELALQRIQPSGIDNLDILPCGPRPTDPGELLSGSRLGELVSWAESRYDQILIDSPPILAASDAALVGKHVDGLVIVVQPDKNHRHKVVRAVEGIVALGVNLLGTVVNRVSADGETGYYYASGYGYGYGYGYGEGYGADDDVDFEEQGDQPREQISTTEHKLAESSPDGLPEMSADHPLRLLAEDEEPDAHEQPAAKPPRRRGKIKPRRVA